MDSCSLSNLQSPKINKNARLLKMKLVLCRWAHANLSCSATKRLTSRIDSGSSWSWWTVVHSLPCSRSLRANTPRSSASIVFTRHSKVSSTYIDKTSSTVTLNPTTSLSKLTVRSNLPILDTQLSSPSSNRVVRVKLARSVGWPLN